MEKGPQKKLLQLVDGSKATERAVVQHLELKKKVIKNQHQLTVEIVQDRQEELKINNYFAKIEGENLVKITEIKVDNKVIKIIDRLHAKDKQTNSSSNTESESNKAPKNQAVRKQILGKKPFINPPDQIQDNDCKLRDTKNLVKNLMRLFQAWLQEKEEITADVYKSLSDMMKTNKFNNSFIVKISKNDHLRRAFLHFCQKDVQQFIKKSKIHDKVSHLQALKKYQSICLEEEDIISEQSGKKQKQKSNVKNEENQGGLKVQE